MVNKAAAPLVCSLCDDICKRGSKLKCCSVRACRACAVVELAKNKKCWQGGCGKDASSVNDLVNDEVLRKAVEYFKENGKINPEHEKELKTTKVPKKTGATKAAKKSVPTTKKGKEKIVYVDVADKFSQPCVYGANCQRKACLFTHDGSAKGSGGEKECRYGVRCTTKGCKFSHPKVNKVNKPCFNGPSCRMKDCKFQHENPGFPGGGNDLRSVLQTKKMMEMASMGMMKQNMVNQAMNMMRGTSMMNNAPIGGMMGMGMDEMDAGGSLAMKMKMEMEKNMRGMGGGGMSDLERMLGGKDWGAGSRETGKDDDFESMQNLKRKLEDMMESMDGGSRRASMSGGYGGPMKRGDGFNPWKSGGSLGEMHSRFGGGGPIRSSSMQHRKGWGGGYGPY